MQQKITPNLWFDTEAAEFKFDEAVSFQFHYESQEEVDYYWERLSEGGEDGPCGWLKDRYGVEAT